MTFALKICIGLVLLWHYQESMAEPVVLEPTMTGANLSSHSIAWVAPSISEVFDPCATDPNCPAIAERRIKLSHGFGGLARPGQSLFLRSEIINRSDEPQKYVLTIDWVMADQWQLLQKVDHQKTLHVAYRKTPIMKRPTKTHYLSIEVTFPPGKSILISKIDTLDFFSANIRVWDHRSLSTFLSHERVVNWFFYGVLIALILSFLSIYFSSKDPIFSWPAFSLFFLLLFDAGFSNFDREFLKFLNLDFIYPKAAYIHLIGVIASIGLCITLQNVGDIKTLHPRFTRIYRYLVIFHLISMPFLYFLHPGVNTLLLVVINSSTFPSLFYHFVWLSKNRIIPMYLGIITWIPFTLGFAVFLAQTFGFIEPNFILRTGLLWSYSMLSLAIGLTMGRKYLTLTNERKTFILKEQSARASMELAKVVQESILTRRVLPGFTIHHYYRPAESVGGDSFFYDTGKDYIFIAIFDVAGHGISAALLTGMIAGALKQVFHYEAKINCAPTHLLTKITTKLNDTIIQFSRGSNHHLVTMACSLIEPKKSRLFYLNSGHVPTYVINADHVKILTSPGSPLGIRRDPIFTIKECRLEQDDKILFLTDGILENLTSEGIAIKEKHLRIQLDRLKALDAKTFGEQFENFLTFRFSPVKINDDMTFLVFGHSTRFVG